MSSCQDDTPQQNEEVNVPDESYLTEQKAKAVYGPSHSGSRVPYDVDLDVEQKFPVKLTIEEIRDRLGDEAVSEIQDEPENNLQALIHQVGCEVHITGEVDRHRTIENIRSDDLNNLISAEVRVTDRTEQMPMIAEANLMCADCHYDMTVQPDINCQTEREIVNKYVGSGCPGAECSAPKSAYGIRWQNVVIADAQQAIVQDLHTLTGTANPTDIKVNLYGALVNEVEAGETVTLTAMLQIQENENGHDYYLDAVGVKHHDKDYSGVEISDEDKERIREIADSPHAHSRLKSSIAPQIKGDYDLARSALLLQQFGGVVREHDDEWRHTIHVGLVGDPGTGKSDLARFTEKVAPNGVYKAGDKSSEVGLTAAVTREDRFKSSEWTLHGGALVKADGGHAVVDELDKASDAVQTSLHTPMSEMKVEVSKASIDATLPTRCSVTVVANPDGERFDPHQNIPNQIPLNDALWSRFDAIIPFHDQPDPEEDKMIADAILSSARGETPDVVEPELMQKYIAYARRIDPVLNDEADAYLNDQWTQLRQQSEDGKVAVGPRQLKGMVRFAEASARVRLSEEANKADAERAASIMKRWMDQVARDAEGHLNGDIYKTGENLSKRERRNLVCRIVQERGEAGDEPGAERDKVTSEILDKRDDVDKQTIVQDINGLIGMEDTLDQEDGKLFDVR